MVNSRASKVYADAQKSCGLKAGDYVRVECAAQDHECGWDGVWASDMDVIIGKTGRIATIYPDKILVCFEMLEDQVNPYDFPLCTIAKKLYYLPYFVLTKVDKEVDKPVNKPCQLQEFDKVLVRDSDEEFWKPAFFGYHNYDSIYQYVMAGGFPYKYCIPYKGNEKLIGTTDKPKAGEKE